MSNANAALYAAADSGQMPTPPDFSKPSYTCDRGRWSSSIGDSNLMVCTPRAHCSNGRSGSELKPSTDRATQRGAERLRFRPLSGTRGDFPSRRCWRPAQRRAGSGYSGGRSISPKADPLPRQRIGRNWQLFGSRRQAQTTPLG
jgi:hypothetical protein